MATYSAVSASEKDADSPINVGLIDKLDQNPHAIAEGATGAPKIQAAALDVTPAAGDFENWSYKMLTTLSTSGAYTLGASVIAKETGTYRCVITARRGSSVTTNVRIYKNGAAFGTARSVGTSYTTWTEDLAFTAGDVIGFYYSTSTSNVAYSFNGTFAIRTSSQLNLTQLDGSHSFDAHEH